MNLAGRGMLDGTTVFDLACMPDAEVLRACVSFIEHLTQPIIYDWMRDRIFPELQLLGEFQEWWDSLPQEIKDELSREAT